MFVQVKVSKSAFQSMKGSTGKFSRDLILRVWQAPHHHLDPVGPIRLSGTLISGGYRIWASIFNGQDYDPTCSRFGGTRCLES